MAIQAATKQVFDDGSELWMDAAGNIVGSVDTGGLFQSSPSYVAPISQSIEQVVSGLASGLSLAVQRAIAPKPATQPAVGQAKPMTTQDLVIAAALVVTAGFFAFQLTKG